MSLGEFELIQRFFSWPSGRSDVSVGIGDDTAVVDVPAGQQLVVTTDTLVEGVHFPAHTSPFDTGHKSLAVSLSDLAAMGARPRWFTLALTLPKVDENWLSGFSSGLRTLAEQQNIVLVGGDTTKGPLTISIQAMGVVGSGQAVLRSTAKPGDDIYVTGTLGDAALGLEFALETSEPGITKECRSYCLQRLNRPEPRVRAGISLAPFLTAMIDCSDGFVADLGHILASSGCGAELQLAALPLSSALQVNVEKQGWRYPLSGGDDYELIFTASPRSRCEIIGIAENLNAPVTRVGKITEGGGIKITSADGQLLDLTTTGYTHF